MPRRPQRPKESYPMISLRLPSDLLERLNRVAKILGTNRTELIQRILYAGIGTVESEARERAREFIEQDQGETSEE